MALFPLKPAVQEIFATRDPLEITLTSFGGSGTSADVQQKQKRKQKKTRNWNYR